MKKFAAIIIIAIMTVMTISTAFAKTAYDPEKLHFVIVAVDEETEETYTTTVTYKTTVKRIQAGLVKEVYLLDMNRLIPVDFSIDAENNVILVNHLTNEPITQ